jgi:hypothetical protein
MREHRLETAIEQRLNDAAERHRVGSVSGVAGTKLTVVTSGGATLTVPRLATWTPVAGDIVVLALTPAGWIAIGKIA